MVRLLLFAALLVGVACHPIVARWSATYDGQARGGVIYEGEPRGCPATYSKFTHFILVGKVLVPQYRYIRIDKGSCQIQ